MELWTIFVGAMMGFSLWRTYGHPRFLHVQKKERKPEKYIRTDCSDCRRFNSIEKTCARGHRVMFEQNDILPCPSKIKISKSRCMDCQYYDNWNDMCFFRFSDASVTDTCYQHRSIVAIAPTERRFMRDEHGRLHTCEIRHVTFDELKENGH